MSEVLERATLPPGSGWHAVVGAGLAFLLMATCARAYAHSSSFGTEGQLVPFGDIGVELELAAGAPGTGEETARNLSFQVSPSVLYFVAHNLALGIGLDVRYGDYELQSWPYQEIDLGVSVGGGVHVPLSEVVGFFPRLWLGGGYSRREYDELPVPERLFEDPSFAQPLERSLTVEGPYVGARLLLPLVFQLVRATFLSVGPHARLDRALKDGSSTFELGLSAGIGRYF